MSTSSNVSQSTYSPSEPETPQGSTQNRIQSFDQSLNHADLGHSIENSLKNVQKEMHQKRVQALRKELDYLKSTEWEFEYDKGDEDDIEFDQDWFDAQLAETQLIHDMRKDEYENNGAEDITETTDNKNCVRKTGVVTKIDTKFGFALIDQTHYFDISSCSQSISVNDKVSYLGYYDENEKLVVVRILKNEGSFWGEELEEGLGEVRFEQTDQTLLGIVDRRDGQDVYMANGDIKFSLANVAGTFVPIEGDMLEMKCKVISDEDKKAGTSSAEVLEVIAFQPTGLKVTTGTVLEWDGVYGKCDKNIYFNKYCVPSGIEPKVGSKVTMKIIDSFRDRCVYRAIQLQLCPDNENAPDADDTSEESTLQLESDYKLEITHPLSFKVNLNETSQLSLKVTNKCDKQHFINKWIVLSRKKDSQITITPIIDRPHRLLPGHSITFSIVCQPRFLGRAKENMIIFFKGFKVKRVILINVLHKEIVNMSTSANMPRKTEAEKHALMREIKNNKYNIVPGRKMMRTPHFVAVRIGQYHVPDKIWAVLLEDSTKLVHTIDYGKIFANIDDKFPYLNVDLTAYNYADKWHTLMFMEEVQQTIDMRNHDISRAYMTKHQEYLSLEVADLAEKKPSLIIGDRAEVRDIWHNKENKYEGFIHEIRGNCVLIKFAPEFHETYMGSTVSVQFHINKTSFRRSHYAIGKAITNLGPTVLFPSHLTVREPQIPPENLNSIEWFNTNINSCQKAAVSNILLGMCRPMPYCIYGPPGTGKTVTVVETILQILKNIPHSRILVAAPSNSAANLITERMLDYKEKNPYSLVRIIAHYLQKSDNIPVNIKPYCVTVDIAREGTSKSKHEIQDGVNINCQNSFIGRHRVTISTCHTMGSLVHMGFPKDHFTHVIVDEAGQATEPEIMVPLTLTDKENGQIILAGDPMQLGPVVISRYCREYGMAYSYFSRILDTSPYQKDFSLFKGGFNEKLVTKLNDNYRSLKEVFTLPNEMFYDGSLLEKMDRNQPWVERIIEATSDIFGTGPSKSGGIYVYGIRGCNIKAEDTPSWYNSQEGTTVALLASQLFKRNVAIDEMGIITPYIAQIRYIRKMLDGIGLPQPKIGTVEEFQGQERPLILISTVRSTETLVEEDIKHTLGFVKNYQRLNVAITRGRVVVILICDPHLLCTDPMWCKVVNKAIVEGKYMGCDVPKIKN